MTTRTACSGVAVHNVTPIACRTQFAGGACAEGIVEREQAGFDFLDGEAADHIGRDHQALRVVGDQVVEDAAATEGFWLASSIAFVAIVESLSIAFGVYAMPVQQ